MSSTPRRLIGPLAAAVVVVGMGWAPPALAAELPSITATYTVGANPNWVSISPDGSRVVTSNRDSNSASVVTVSTGAIAAVPVGTQPRGVAITPDGTKAFISNFGSGNVTVVNLATGGVIQTVATGPLPGPGSVSGDGVTAFIPNGGFGAGSNTVSKVTVATGIVSGTLSSTLPACLTSSLDGLSFFICKNTTVSIGLFTASAAAVTNVVAGSGGTCSSATFSPNGTTVYASCGNADYVAQIDVASATVTRNITVGSNPGPIAINPAGTRVFVGRSSISELTVITAGGNVSAVTPIGGVPQGIAVSNDGQYVLVTTTNGNLVVLDSSGTQVLRTIALGGTPSGIAVSRTGNFAAISLGDVNQVVIVNLPPAPASGSDVPTAALQQYAPAPGERCGEAPPDAVDFPALVGSRTVGWGTSWAQWPNGGVGGPVCSRQPFYTSAGSWSVR